MLLSKYSLFLLSPGAKKTLPFQKIHFYAIFPLINVQKYFAWLSLRSFPASRPIFSQIGDVKVPPMVHSLMHPLLKSGGSLRPPPPKWGKVWRASALEGRQARHRHSIILYIPYIYSGTLFENSCLEVLCISDNMTSDNETNWIM